ncbi:MAG: transcriptional regulator [Sphingomonadales bacterium 32-68-7]|nr:MAG: transcriptional regulator [Sphingomonadales bacterium 12-68-11]OYX09645.1 MAG: transcriptional regulator [Sphingomonadales bacterium 32-68-7]
MPIHPGRFAAAHAGPIVVFLIGMRINHFHKPGKWLPVARAMPAMLRELYADPASGFLGAETLLGGVRVLFMLQYWRDFDSLEGYARDPDRVHWPAWAAFNKAVGGNGSVGIFHETYCVDAGRFETIYANMPAFGLGKVSGVVPATGSRNAARERMKASRPET